MPVLSDGPGGGRSDELTVGLVNNMPDAALQATERQFMTLLRAAAGDRPVRFRLFSLPDLPRSEAAAAHIAAHYTSTDALARAAPAQTPLDALIVTGCEPRAATLSDEPYWPALTRLIDWAAGGTVTTLWSCLAAHAAVLHLDGVARHRLPDKRSGLFACEAVAPHALLADAPRRLVVPHSRWNDLRESELRAHGYKVLTRSREAGVDLFVKRRDSLFVFFQGHPEYDVDSLAREYRRDVARFLRGERADYPIMPHAYFSTATEAAFASIHRQALADRTAVRLGDLPRTVSYRPGLVEAWQASVLPVFTAWLTLAGAGRKAGRAAA